MLSMLGGTLAEARNWETAITAAAVALIVVGVAAVIAAYRAWTR